MVGNLPQLTYTELHLHGTGPNQLDKGMRACLNKTGREPIWNTLTQLTKLKFQKILNSMNMLFYIVCCVKMSTSSHFTFKNVLLF